VTLVDFFIGTHAEVERLSLLTRAALSPERDADRARRRLNLPAG
jgi:hypothetical protein